MLLVGATDYLETTIPSRVASCLCSVEPYFHTVTRFTVISCHFSILTRLRAASWKNGTSATVRLDGLTYRNLHRRCALIHRDRQPALGVRADGKFVFSQECYTTCFPAHQIICVEIMHGVIVHLSVTVIYLKRNTQHETVIPVVAKGMTLLSSRSLITVEFCRGDFWLVGRRT